MAGGRFDERKNFAHVARFNYFILLDYEILSPENVRKYQAR